MTLIRLVLVSIWSAVAVMARASSVPCTDSLLNQQLICLSNQIHEGTLSNSERDRFEFVSLCRRLSLRFGCNLRKKDGRVLKADTVFARLFSTLSGGDLSWKSAIKIGLLDRTLTAWMLDLLREYRIAPRNPKPTTYSYHDHGLLQFIGAVLLRAPPDWPVIVHGDTTLLRELLLYGQDTSLTVPRLFTELVQRLPTGLINSRKIGVRLMANAFLEERRGLVDEETAFRLMLLIASSVDDLKSFELESEHGLIRRLERRVADCHQNDFFAKVIFQQWVKSRQSDVDKLRLDADRALFHYVICLFCSPDSWLQISARLHHDPDLLPMLRWLAGKLLGVTSRSDSFLIERLIKAHRKVRFGANYLHLAAQIAIASKKPALKAIKSGFGLRNRAEIRLNRIGIRDPLLALALIQDPDWAKSAANNDDQRQFIRSLLHYSSVGVRAVTYAVMPTPDIPYYVTEQLEHDLRQRAFAYYGPWRNRAHQVCVLCSSQPSECSICLQPAYCKSRSQVLSPCGHFFHPACIQTWLDTSPTCPLCRQIVTDSVKPNAGCKLIPLMADVQARLILGKAMPDEWLKAFPL